MEDNGNGKVSHGFFQLYRERRTRSISNIYNNIDTLETGRKNMRMIISEELCKGTYLAHIIEDLLNLVGEINDTADYTKRLV